MNQLPLPMDDEAASHGRRSSTLSTKLKTKHPHLMEPSLVRTVAAPPGIFYKKKPIPSEKKLLLLRDLGPPIGGVVGRIIVWGYDTRLPKDDVETALRNHFSNCGMITTVCVPINYGARVSLLDGEELDDNSYIYFLTGEGAVDKALLLNGTDVGGWTVYVKPYPFKPNSEPMVWVTVEGFDTSLCKIGVRRYFIQLFSLCGEVDERDVYVSNSGSADLIVKGKYGEVKVLKLSERLMRGNQLVLRNVCYGHIRMTDVCVPISASKREEEAVVASWKTSKPLPMDESGEKEMKLMPLKDLGYAVPGEVGRIIVWGYDTTFTRSSVETILRHHFSQCGRITNVCVSLDISYIYFVGGGAVDKALLLNRTDVEGRTVDIVPYPFRPTAKPMVWLTVKGYDTSLSKTEITLELIKIFSYCGEVDKHDVYVFKSGSACLIVRGEDAAEKVRKLHRVFIGQHKLVLQDVYRGRIQIDFRPDRSRYAVGEILSTIARRYDTKLTQDVVESGRITDVCVPIRAAKKEEDAVVASWKTSKPLPMDESGEKEMKLLLLKESDHRSAPVPGCGVVGRIIVWGYDTRLPKGDVETALRNHFSNCGMITTVCVPQNFGTRVSPVGGEELDDISYIYFFTGEGAVDKALLLNGTDVGGWTVYVKPYPFKPNLEPMVWVTVEGFDTSVLSKIEIKRELIQLFSSCGEVHEYDVHVFKSGSAELIVKGEDAAEKVPKLLNGSSSFMGQHHQLVLRNVCYGQIRTDFRRGCGDRSGYAPVRGCGEVGRIIVRGYDTRLPQEVVERALINHFSSCGRITDVCVPIYFDDDDAEKLKDISYIYFVGEGAVDKALLLNGTDVVGGGWTVNVEAYPFRDDAQRTVWLNVKGFDTSLSENNIELALLEHFSKCGEVNDLCVYKDGSADLIVKGEDAAEKVPKRDGSLMGQHKLVLRNVCYLNIRTVHERLVYVFR